MEVTGVVFRHSPCFSPTTAESRHSHSFPTLKKSNSLRPIRKSFGGRVVSDEFSDNSHLQYYCGPRMAVDEIESKKKEMKKKLKLLKGLSKNLYAFSEMGFYLNPDNGLDQKVKGQMISEATEVLVGQLQKLKEEKMESKKMKKAKKKASQMMVDSSSESSSSESDVVNMNQLKTSTSTVKDLEKAENSMTENAMSIVNDDCGKKIEVCMGGKCKKSGAAVLLENFQAAVAGEAEVVGCKCMGKCREGPNVMVRREEVAVSNSLCVGVGLEDVDRIVTNFFGGGGRSSSDMVVPILSSS